jgi:hypothetical protein
MKKNLSLIVVLLILLFNAKTNAQEISIAEIRAVFFSLGYEIHDYDQDKEMIYFVGERINTPKQKQGIIAYQSIKDFKAKNNEGIIIKEIPSTTNLFRIEAYTNQNGETIIASIGTQNYSQVYYQEMPEKEFYDTDLRGPELPIPAGEEIIEPQITGANLETNDYNSQNQQGWIKDKEQTYGCLVLHQPNKETQHYHLPNNQEIEKIEDLYLEKDYIVVVSTLKDKAPTYSHPKTIEHSINKNDYNDRKSYILEEGKTQYNYHKMRPCIFLNK